MGGISDPFLRSGNLDIERIYVKTLSQNWNITVNVINRGTERTVITFLEVRTEYDSLNISLNIPIVSGEEKSFQFILTQQNFNPDTYVEICLHTSDGEEYMEPILLPAQK